MKVAGIGANPAGSGVDAVKVAGTGAKLAGPGVITGIGVNVGVAAGAAGTLVPHPSQKTVVAFSAEPQLPQNLAIFFISWGHAVYSHLFSL